MFLVNVLNMHSDYAHLHLLEVHGQSRDLRQVYLHVIDSVDRVKQISHSTEVDHYY